MKVQKELCQRGTGIRTCRLAKSNAALCFVTLLCAPIMSVCHAGFAPPPPRTALLSVRNHRPAVVGVRIRASQSAIGMSSEVDDEFRNKKRDASPEQLPKANDDAQSGGDEVSAPIQNMLSSLQDGWKSATKMPPIQVDDANVLFYDVFLLINLTVSISFWAIHRLKADYLWSAFSEGCLLSVLWIAAGLYSGAFLFSAVDGHYPAGDERGGPKAAGLLAFHTFVNAINLRLVVALAMAVLDHRAVGSTASEQLIPLEVGFGLVLMSAWRAIHSSYISRL